MTNEQLEQKVKLRIKEIFQQKEEIKRKVEELAVVNKEVQLINENLEQAVQKRTDKIKKQNKKLIDYAFTNAHHIRGPLARILGLLYLIKRDVNTPDLQQDYMEKLSFSAQELDASIKNATRLLDDDISQEEE